MGGKIGGSFKVDSFDDVIVFANSLDSAPEIPLFILVFMTKFEGLCFNRDAFFN